jgi:pimeloyl-ACP methyl ester carboxylesterase
MALLVLCGAVVAALWAALWRSPAGSYAWTPPAGELHDVGLRARVLGDARDGAPTVVLLHGLAGSHRYFGASFDRLSLRGRVVALDLLGFGGSPGPETSSYDATAHAEAVRRSLESLGVRPPVLLVGHSAGALVALQLASDWPYAVVGVVAFGPPLYRSQEEARARIAGLGAHVKLFAMDGRVARWVCDAFCRNRALAADVFSTLRRDLPVELASDATLHSWTSYSRTLSKLILAGPVNDAVPRLRAPALMIVGDQDPIADAAFLAELAQRAVGVRVETWEGGHDLPLSAPERAVQAIERFLDDVSPSR